MPMVGGRIFRLGSMAFIVAAPFLAHFALTRGQPRIATYGLILAQAAFALGYVFTRTKPPYRYLALAGLAACGIALCYLRVTGDLVLASGVPHAMAYCGLLALFGSSLAPGHEPTISYYVRMIHGPTSSAVQQYTRKVTIAWCVFFALQLVGSAALLVFAPLAWWSTFVNLLNAPLVLGMFICERFSRPLWVEDPPREYFSDILRVTELVRGGMPKRDLHSL